MTYATIDSVKAGTTLIADGGFTCIPEGTELLVQDDAEHGLFVQCQCGSHILDGQVSDDGQTYIGLTLKEAAS